MFVSTRPLGPVQAGPPPFATATSDPFTPAAPGAYRWIASYSGDATYLASSGACNDPDETSVVGTACPANLRPTIIGTDGPDDLVGTPGPDVIFGLGGNDRINGLGGDDIICGGDGDDQISGGEGNDKLFGDAGDDRLSGGDGDDELFAGTGNDRLSGDTGNDVLRASDAVGGDFLAGGLHTDTCIGDQSDTRSGCEP